MIFPYSFTPWLIRKIIKSGTTVKKVFMRQEKVEKVSEETLWVSHYGNTEKIPLTARVYTPEGEGPFPITIFFHGGGWVICTIDTHDHICRHICNKAKSVVISVDYRLAPEFKFPIPVEDAYASTVYIHEHAAEFNGDPTKICLSGDSAGGNLSIVCSQVTRERNGPKFSGLALFYPSTDLRDASDCPYASYDGKCIGLTKEDSAWFLNHYMANMSDRCDPRASPIVTEDLHDLPPCLIITGEHDRIRDPGEEYGRKLQKAGVTVTMKRYNEVGHGFLSIGAPEVAVQSLDYASEWLWNVFSGHDVPNTPPTPLITATEANQ